MTLDKCQEFVRWEFTEVAYYVRVIDYLKEKGIKSSLDVGACTGEVTKVLLEKIPTLERCILVEPMTENYEFIKKNLGDDSRIEMFHKAVWYGNKEICIGRIPGPNINAGGGSIFSSREPEIIKTITLEEIGYVDFIKMDIEGAEKEIIENSSLLKDIPFIEVEFHHYNEDLLSPEERRNFLKKWLPLHEILYGGFDGLGKEHSRFLVKT